MVADYGKGETAETQTQAIVTPAGSGIYSVGGSKTSSVVNDQRGIFQVKPNSFDLEGTPSSVFNSLSDRVCDHKVKGIAALELLVGQVLDYRKLGTTLPLLARFPMQIEQTVTIQTGDQFVRLEYQGPMRGFQSFFTPTTALLNNQDVRANVQIKLIFEFNSPVPPGGSEINAISQALSRNPVDRMNLTAKVTY